MQICGGIIELNSIYSKGTISKPTSTFKNDCIWTIKSNDLSDKIFLTFNKLNHMKKKNTDEQYCLAEVKENLKIYKIYSKYANKIKLISNLDL